MGGFVQKRRGVLQHLSEGRITIGEYVVLDVLLMLADPRVGVWVGSAVLLSLQFGGAVSVKVMRTVLGSLEAKGYIRWRPWHVQGSKSPHPFVIDKYLISAGKLKGRLVKTSATTDWRKPVCYEVCDGGSEVGSDGGSDEGSEALTAYVPAVRHRWRRLLQSTS
jgi:hypothetical protein